MNAITPEQQQARDDLLAWLDAGAPETPCTAYPEPIVGFYMSMFNETRKGCGTLCCMAGFVLRNVLGYPNNPANLAASLLGLQLSKREVDALFVPSESVMKNRPFPIETRDTAWAARTLRHLFATGEVDWEKTR